VNEVVLKKETVSKDLPSGPSKLLSFFPENLPLKAQTRAQL
jgi:hypothetical protein